MRARPIAGYAWSIPGLVVVALMLLWAVHDGGYDADTWYWGALLVLGLLAAVVTARGWRAIQLSRSATVALVAFALYVAWSYLSISWAASPGDALTGSNRALLYLLVFATMLVLPWTVRGALIALVTFALGIGVVAVVLLVRLASADHVAALVIDGRLAAPTGYFNSTAALFTIGALTAIALAARRELPGLLRGALIGFACAGLQLAVIVQSRGWLFTLPLVLIAAIVLLPDRLRVAAAAVVPAAATLAVVHRLLHVFQASPGAALNHAVYSSRTRFSARVLDQLCGGHAARLGRVAHTSPAAERNAPARARDDSPCWWPPVQRSPAGWPSRTATRSNSSPASGTASATRRARTPARLTSPTSAADATTSGAWPWMRSSPTPWEGSARITSTTTTCGAGAPTKSRRGRTASSCGCSRTPDWLAPACSLHS